jgi:glucokinase
MNQRVLGIDIGGTNTPFGLVDGDGCLLWRDRVDTRPREPLSALLERLNAKLEEALATPGLPRPVAVGVGAPNANARTGWVESPPNINWGSVDLAGELGRCTGLPVFLTNDANAAALGEWIWGAGRGVDDLLVITLGTGLGSGLIVEGRLIHGASGHAGELGHVCVEPGGRPCNCGLRGCLETWVSAGGLVATAREAGLDLAPWCDAGEAPSPRALFRAAQAGEARAAEVFRVSGEMLARGLALAVHLLSPGRVVVCGGVARAGDWLLGPARAALPDLLLEPFRGSVEIVPGQLDADEAGVLGAAAWALRGLEERRHG